MLMKNLSVWIIAILLLTSTNIFASAPSQSEANLNQEKTSSPARSGFSLIGGLLILASIGAGYSVKRLYTIRIESEDGK
jgi:uncharacterized membrane protein YphA (DoxX/SURF4 family)